MYTKANFRTNDEIIIPENYSGNAFGEKIIQQPMRDTSDIHMEDENISTKEVVSDVRSKDQQHQNSFLTPFLPPKISRPTGLFNNIGLEELLIIGVLILLSQSDSDDDILLLLFLLLFYK